MAPRKIAKNPARTQKSTTRVGFDPAGRIPATVAQPDKWEGTNAPLIVIHHECSDQVVVERPETLAEPFGGLALRLALPGGFRGAVAWWMDVADTGGH